MRSSVYEVLIQLILLRWLFRGHADGGECNQRQRDDKTHREQLLHILHSPILLMRKTFSVEERFPPNLA